MWSKSKMKAKQSVFMRVNHDTKMPVLTLHTKKFNTVNRIHNAHRCFWNLLKLAIVQLNQKSLFQAATITQSNIQSFSNMHIISLASMCRLVTSDLGKDIQCHV